MIEPGAPLDETCGHHCGIKRDQAAGVPQHCARCHEGVCDLDVGRGAPHGSPRHAPEPNLVRVARQRVDRANNGCMINRVNP